MTSTELYTLIELLGGNSTSFRDQYDDWTRERKGKHWFLEQTITYASDPTIFNVSFPHAMKVNFIEQIWNDTTAKGFAIRKYTVAGSSVYSDWNTKTANQDTSDITLFTDGLAMSSGSRLQIVHDTLTVGKIATVKIQMDEI
jgi:hypothetical protein